MRYPEVLELGEGVLDRGRILSPVEQHVEEPLGGGRVDSGLCNSFVEQGASPCPVIRDVVPGRDVSVMDGCRRRRQEKVLRPALGR